MLAANKSVVPFNVHRPVSIRFCVVTCLKVEEGSSMKLAKGDDPEVSALARAEAEALMSSGVGSSHETTPEAEGGEKERHYKTRSESRT